MKVHVLILNYNGAELLKEYLPSFLEASRRSHHTCRVSVVDNVSQDASRLVVEKFKDVGWIPMRENKVLSSYNEAASGLDDDILILMNNDVDPAPDFVDPLVDPFEREEDLFLTSPTFYSIDRRSLECARAGGGIYWGLFWSKAIPTNALAEKESITFNSGMGAVDRKKFMALGGYDSLYAPGTLEDVDLCFRAWHRGWKSLYVPKSRVYHVGQVSFKKRFGSQGLRIINSRNLYLFMWKNINDPWYLIEHAVFLLPRIAWTLFKGRTDLAIGFWCSLARLPEALSKRSHETQVMGDRQIFNLFNKAASK